ncbi:MAG TPA: hypothetical protein VGI24_05165 [Solirubrobacteraceae bacterium]|jgi:hypothetical protein
MIASLEGDTAVQAYGGVEVWSDYDVSSRSWHVVVRRDGQISMPSIPSARRSIEVDVGPGPSGSPMLVYTECAGGCQLVVSGVDGSDPKAVLGSEGASYPTIWGDRVAWVSGRTKVMSSLLDGAGRRMLRGAPRRKCYFTGDTSATTVPRLRCGAPREPVVEALQLYRSQLALIDTFDLNDGLGSNGTTTEVRTEAITGGPQRLIALLTVGEGDESWAGPSWSDGKLYFYEDEDGTCGCSAVYRFDPVRKTYARARASGYLTGFSMLDDQAYETTAPGDPRNGGIMCGEYENTPCVVRLSAPFAFTPISAKRLVFTP